MNELINVTVRESGFKAVSVRELYNGLGLSRTNFKNWIKFNVLENEFFFEGEDWAGCMVSIQGNETMDFAISIEMAKHIAMMAKTAKSHEYRNYFIACEKIALESPLDTYIGMSEEDRAIAYFTKSKEAKQLQIENETNKPKVEAFKVLIDTTGLMDWNTIAKSLGLGKNIMLNLLRAGKILQADGLPYQAYMKYFEIKHGVKNNIRYTKVLTNVKGLEYLRKKIIKIQAKEIIDKEEREKEIKEVMVSTTKVVRGYRGSKITNKELQRGN